MRVIKDFVFILMVGTLSGTAIATSAEPAHKSPTSASTSAKPKSIANLSSKEAKLAEETKLTAAAIVNSGADADEKLVDSMVPEGAKLVDGTNQNEFYIVPKDGVMPKVETAQTAAVTKGLDEAAEMINKIDVPKLESALGEKVHNVGTAPEAVKVIKTALGPKVTIEAKNSVKPPIRLVEAAPISDVTPSPETAPAEKPSETTPAASESTPTESQPTTTEPQQTTTEPAKTTEPQQVAQPEKATQSKAKKPHHNSKAKHHHPGKAKQTKLKAHHHQVKAKECHKPKVKAKVKTKSISKPKAKTASPQHHHAKKPCKHPSTKHHVVYHGKTYKVKRFQDLH